MQAILTRILPATNTRPTRYRVSANRGSITIAADPIAKEDAIGSAQAHRRAALQLIWRFIREDKAEYGTPENKNPWGRHFATGCLPNGDFAHVYIEDQS